MSIMTTSSLFSTSTKRGTRSTTLCAKAVNLWNWCITHHILLSAAYLPGILNMIADSLSGQFVINHKWELQDVHDILNQWRIPTRDLFASHINSKCNVYCSRGGLGHHSQGDTFILSWSDKINYTFPPLPLLPQVLHKIGGDKATVILITSCWPKQFWFPSLLCMSTRPPVLFPTFPNLLTQCNCEIRHPSPQALHLRAWYLNGHLL